MGWLKKFGQIMLAGGQAAVAFTPVGHILAPILKAVIPGTKDDQIIDRGMDILGGMGETIKTIEIAGAALSLSGPDKLKASIPAISNAIMLSAIMCGLPPGDRAMYDEGVQEFTNGLVKIMNSRAE